MKKVLPIHHYLQRFDVAETEWKNKSCGIVCVKMILTYFEKDQEIAIDDLIKEGLIIGGYNNDPDRGGWYHEALVRLLHNHGVHAYSEEFRSLHVSLTKEGQTPQMFEERFIKDGLNKIKDNIDSDFPTIISVSPGFNNVNSNHLVLVIGYSEDEDGLEGFFVADPNEDFGDNKPRFFELSHIKKHWRKFAIFTYS